MSAIRKPFNIPCVAILVCLSTCVLAEDDAAEKPWLKAAPERVEAWKDLRFGMFIHWDPVSLKGAEIGWSRKGPRRGRTGTGSVPMEEYDNLYKQFNPVGFDADEWVRIAKMAGMNCMVFTTKHHGGFSMFDSKWTDYKITSPDSPYGRDITGELTEACHRAKMPIGFYYSPPDWRHADYRNERHDAYIRYLHRQLKELCANYGKIDVIWFDGLGGKAEDWDSENLFKMIRELQPDIVINNRAGLDADFETPEQRVGAFQRDPAWESCITICRQWAWKPDDRMKSLNECLGTFIRTIGGDGNLLFNVGPMPDGRIEPRQVERLREMGRWIGENAEAVYGTRGGPFKPGRWGASTHKDNHVYLHVMKWHEPGKLILPPVEGKITGAVLLSGEKISVEQTAEKIVVNLPEERHAEVATVVKLSLDGPAGGIDPVDVLPIRSDSAAFGGKALASNVFQKDKRYDADKAFDDDEETRWATDNGTTQAWLSVDLGKPVAISKALIMEAFSGRVERFELQRKVGEKWETFHRGEGIGEKAVIEFPPVTARVFRLNILEGKIGPTIWEFRLYPEKRE